MLVKSEYAQPAVVAQRKLAGIIYYYVLYLNYCSDDRISAGHVSGDILLRKFGLRTITSSSKLAANRRHGSFFIRTLRFIFYWKQFSYGIFDDIIIHKMIILYYITIFNPQSTPATCSIYAYFTIFNLGSGIETLFRANYQLLYFVIYQKQYLFRHLHLSHWRFFITIKRYVDSECNMYSLVSNC